MYTVDSHTDSFINFFFVCVFPLFYPNSFKFRISDLQTDGKKSLTAETTNSREGKFHLHHRHESRAAVLSNSQCVLPVLPVSLMLIN